MATFSAALRRVKNHTYLDNDETDPLKKKKTRQEGIWLELTELQALIDHLRQNHPHINRVSFMIGKLDNGRGLIERHTSHGNEVELTVEVLPFHFSRDATGREVVELLTIDGVIGALKIDDFPFDNEEGGGGGNQKVPPPSVRTP